MHVPQMRVPGGYLIAGKILVGDKQYASFPDEIPFTLISLSGDQVVSGYEHRDLHVPPAKEIQSLYPKLWKILQKYIAPWSANDVNED